MEVPEGLMSGSRPEIIALCLKNVYDLKSCANKLQLDSLEPVLFADDPSERKALGYLE